jgi:hypothetical protein
MEMRVLFQSTTSWPDPGANGLPASRSAGALLTGMSFTGTAWALAAQAAAGTMPAASAVPASNVTIASLLRICVRPFPRAVL